MPDDVIEAVQNWRYERKIRIDDIGVNAMESIILSNRVFFRKLHEERQINNIYLDDADYNAFFANIDGSTHRKKYRIRWYGDLFGDARQPILEAKIKEGLVGSKERYRLKDFRLNKSFATGFVKALLAGVEGSTVLKSTLRGLRPTLINSYVRRYYISSDGLYRLTLDYDLSFYKVETDSGTVLSKRHQNGLVVEIKYDLEADSGVDIVTNDLVYRISKNSKYANGFESTQY